MLLRRARAGRSTLEVATAAGISPETLRKIETGRIATPSFPTVAALAGVLELSLDALWLEVLHAGAPTTHDGAPSQEGAPSRRRGQVAVAVG